MLKKRNPLLGFLALICSSSIVVVNAKVDLTEFSKLENTCLYETVGLYGTASSSADNSNVLYLQSDL